MAWDEQAPPRRNTRNRGCTTRKCLLVASCLLVFAALVALYVALVLQRIDLTVLTATVSGLNVVARPANSTVSSPPRNGTMMSWNSTQQSHNTSTAHNAGMAANSSFYLSDVALTLSLLFKNPTTSMGTYHYHQLNWQLFYHNITIANGSIPPFSRDPHQAHLPVTLHLKGAKVALPRVVALALQANRTALNLQAGTTAYVQLLGKFVDFEFPVYCNLSFPPPKNGKASLHSKTSCMVKAS